MTKRLVIAGRRDHATADRPLTANYNYLVSTSPGGSELLRFGTFEIDGSAGELRRNGSLIRLQPQPFKVLLLLARNPGEIVDRDWLRREIWGGTSVDFDRSLNVCIAQIRLALSDDPENPRFIQTVPRRGYRFLATVEPVRRAVRAEEREGEALPDPRAHRGARRWILSCLVGSILILSSVALAHRIARRSDALRLAVMPFDTIGLDGEADLQVEGIFDELLTALAGVQPDRLAIIGRRSVMRFRRESGSLREIGERLNVPYAIEGTTRRDGGRFIVAVRLAKTDDDALVWSETFELTEDPAAFEERVVANVSAAVLQKLFPGAAEALPESGCRDGWESYRTGRMLADQGRLVSMEKSVSLLQQSNCTAARGALADTLIRLARLQPRHPEYWQRARSAADRMDTAPAHLALGNIAFWRDWDWKTAEREFQAALRRNPSNPDAHHDLAWLLAALGRRNEAVSALDRAVALDPLSGRTHMDAAWILLQAGRFDRAAAEARRALELDPQIPEAYSCIARALLYAGDDRAALEAIRPIMTADESKAIAGLPPREALRQVLISKPGADPYQRALWLASAGTSEEEALTALEQAFHDRSLMMPLVAVDPGFMRIRGEARFQKIVKDLRL
jgi:DNA-binding winged helix-turn-helix (wHTH) protein/TolB-like protein/Flp pilus assembly protein TadD